MYTNKSIHSVCAISCIRSYKDIAVIPLTNQDDFPDRDTRMVSSAKGLEQVLFSQPALAR